MALAFPEGKAELEDCIQPSAKAERSPDQPQPDRPSQGDPISGFNQQEESFSEEIIGEVSSEREAKTRASGLYPLWVLWGLSHEPTLRCTVCCGGDGTQRKVRGTAPLPPRRQQPSRVCGSALSSFPSSRRPCGPRVFSLISPFPLAWSWEDTTLAGSEVSLSLAVR